MPFAMTTSNALRRSVVTMRRAPPTSKISRTLPLETCLRPGREHAVTGADSTMTNLHRSGVRPACTDLPAGSQPKTPLFYGIAASGRLPSCDDGAREAPARQQPPLGRGHDRSGPALLRQAGGQAGASLPLHR